MGNRDRLAMAPTLQNQRLLAEYDAAYANFLAVNGGILPNDAQRRQMINEVRLNIKCDIMRTYINNARAEEISKNEKVDLTRKIVARSGAEKTAMIDRRKRMNAADREIAERTQADLSRSQTEFANPLEQAALALESQENLAIETHRLPIVGDLEATLEDRINNTLPAERDGRIAALEAQLAARVNQIRTDNDSNRIEQDIRFATGFKRRALRDAQALATTATTDYIDAVRNAGASIPQGAGRAVNLTFPPSPAGELAASGNPIAAAYDGELTQLEAQRTRREGVVQVETARVEALITAERTRVDTELEALRTAQAAHRTAEGALTNAAQAVARREPEELVTGAARLGEMQGFVNAVGARVVTDAEIRTLPIADLMERIAGATLPAGVAAPNDNERLLIASFAKSEFSGQEYEAGNQPGANELQALNDISAIILNIGPPMVVLGEQAVLMRGNENLANLINAAGLGWTPDQITQNIVAARHLVARRLNSRYTERVRNEQGYWNGRLVPDERASETIGREIDRERAQLEAADAITAKREELYVRAYDVLQPQNQELRDRLFNANLIAQDDTNYSAEERNKDLHAGYVGWLREIYPGYDGNSNEAELFNALNTIISEQELADVLNEQLGLALPPGVNQINNTLRAIDMAFGAGTLNRINFEQAFIAIVNLVRQKARKV